MLFIVSIAFEFVHDPPKSRGANLWEEQFVLVDALDAELAAKQALSMYKPAGHSYETAADDRVTVIPRFVIGTYEVNASDIAAGQELFSRFIRATEAFSLAEKFKDDEF